MRQKVTRNLDSMCLTTVHALTEQMGITECVQGNLRMRRWRLAAPSSRIATKTPNLHHLCYTPGSQKQKESEHQESALGLSSGSCTYSTGYQILFLKV